MSHAAVGGPGPSRTRAAMSTKLFYGVGAAAYGVKNNGFSFFLLLYYNQVLGLDAWLVGLAIMIALIVDSISDPLIGYASDNLHSRWGRRHPFMYAVAVPVAIIYVMLWNPPAGLSDGALFTYLLVLAITVRTLITFYEVPNTSLVAELTDDYDERTSMLSFRYFFGWWGGLLMGMLAYGVFLAATPEYERGVLNPAGYNNYGLMAAGVILVSILLSSLGTHRHIPNLKQPPPKAPLSLRRTFSEFSETLSNRSFLMLFLSAIFGSMAAGVHAALNIYLNTYFWELTSEQIFFFVLGNFLSAALALMIAPRVSARVGKKIGAVSISLLAFLLAPLPIFLRLLDLFPENGDPILMPVLLVFSIVDVALIIIASILSASMVADLVEDSETSTGRRSEGLFFAAQSFVSKSISGVGIFFSTLILALISFPEGAQPGAVDPTIIRDLGLVYAPTLVVFYMLSIAFLSRYRISRDTHEANLRRLSGQPQAATQPQTATASFTNP